MKRRDRLALDVTAHFVDLVGDMLISDRCYKLGIDL